MYLYFGICIFWHLIANETSEWCRLALQNNRWQTQCNGYWETATSPVK
jgi:hypothetical protein